MPRTESELEKGQLIAQRYRIEKSAAHGGMGTVFRAHDQHSGHAVALKVQFPRGTPRQEQQRFLREAEMLSELKHPGIVRYIDHGYSEAGHAYLAMEWLDGEDLAVRLRRSGLKLSETLTLAIRVADALHLLHQRGIVHRDIKPSNLFLPEGDVDRVTVLDFGVARRSLTAALSRMTQTGVVIGTPEYMAPEQARGQQGLGPAADLFSLGCVLFECLAGRPPFSGEHIAAVLGKILFDEAPRLSSIRPELPEALDALIQALLIKDPEQRLGSAAVLRNALRALQSKSLPDAEAPSREQPFPTVRGESGEQQLITILCACDPQPIAEQPTLDARLEPVTQSSSTELREALLQLGAHPERLADGTLVATMGQEGVASSATDLALQAARCALVIRDRWPRAAVAIATGRGVMREHLVVGEAIDRAVALLRTQKSATAGPTSVLLDEVTAGLLDSRFDLIRSEPAAYRLLGERLTVDTARPLLGKPTPCVGREQELRVLESALTACIEEPRALAVLVLAPSGVGKSRLRHEFVRRIHAETHSPTVVLCRAEPLVSGSPYALIRDGLRALFGICPHPAPGESQQALLTARVAQRVAAPDRQRVAEFLGELMSVPIGPEPSPRLRAARSDPKRLADEVSQALCDFLRAECREAAVVIILEDLHWGDAPSVAILDTALKVLRDQPLLVLALGRPELEERFPRLFRERDRQEIRLGGLSRRASERLIQQVLGADVTTATVERLISQAAGNALFLEELIRAAGSGRGTQAPETVRAILQVRVGQLDSELRRVLRAASVYGTTFTDKGLRALLGPEATAAATERWLHQLILAEIIEPCPQSQLPGDAYEFRHVLLRDAAYSLLTDEDLKLCHHFAAGFLEENGESDPQVLAEHYDRAGEPRTALPYYVRSAEQAFLRSDLRNADEACRRAIAGGADGAELGAIKTVESMVSLSRGAVNDALDSGRAALLLLSPGSPRWYHTLTNQAGTASLVGDLSYVRDLVATLDHATPQPEAAADFVIANSLVAAVYAVFGARELAESYLQRARTHIKDAAPSLRGDARAEMFLAKSSGYISLFVGNNPWEAKLAMAVAVDAALRTGYPRSVVTERCTLSLIESTLGAHEESLALARWAYEEARRLDEPYLVETSTMYLVSALIEKDDAESLAEACQHIADLEVLMPENLLIGALTQVLVAILFLHTGDPATAMNRLLRADELLCAMPGLRPISLGYVLSSWLSLGEVTKALAAAKEGELLLFRLGSAGVYEPRLRLGIARAYAATGQDEEARAALRDAVAELSARAACIPDPAARARYLEHNAVNRALTALSLEWRLSE